MKKTFGVLAFFLVAGCGQQVPPALDGADKTIADLTNAADKLNKENERRQLKLDLRQMGLSETDAETLISAGERVNASRDTVLQNGTSMLNDRLRSKATALELAKIWEVSEHEDKMGRGSITFITGHSLNEVNFRFPYEGEQRMNLTVRSGPGREKEVLLIISKGQFNCRMSGCSIAARFGKGTAKQFRVNGPSDGSSNVLFIADTKSFISSMKKHETLNIEAEFYQSGTRVFDFDTSKLPKHPSL